MDYIEKIFNIRIKYCDTEQQYHLPNYMIWRYAIKQAYFENQKVFLLYPKVELDSYSSIRKHIEKMKMIEDIPVVLVMDRITMRERQGMLDSHIPFIVKDKQCYLPFMGMLITERCDAELQKQEKILPSAQALLFYYIYSCKKELFTGDAVTDLGFSAMTITRAVRSLEQAGLVEVYKSGVQKIMTSDLSGKELYEKAKQFLQNPVKRTVFVPIDKVTHLPFAGDSALSMESMLNPPGIACYAAVAEERWKEIENPNLIDEKKQVKLQIWKYDPRILAKENHVDILSLATSYMDDKDERIEECVEEMLSGSDKFKEWHGYGK